MGMCRVNIWEIAWNIYRDYGLVVGTKGENINKVPHETKCLMGHFVSWDTFVSYRLSKKVNWYEFVCYL